LPTSHDEGRPQLLAHLDVSWMVSADLCAVDALARLQLVALRRGRSLEIHGADGTLADLLELLGLDAVVHVCPRCRISASDLAGRGQGKPEDLEERWVEERMYSADARVDDIEHVDREGCVWFTGCPRSIDRGSQ
jgi:hypothetical protein